ncbi:hypothetical protein HPB52_023325 [Rhipicephalus sanguineus]|uniref:Uncharacterized protein n=1 Tax=Rhipicephalus sanguineus TaxID=34632 RepID=A0A9D4T6H7_RHISA|nr:hypothetical protein HPB52_023325 [Rhipicephalus sanguineus]
MGLLAESSRDKDHPYSAGPGVRQGEKTFHLAVPPEVGHIKRGPEISFLQKQQVDGVLLGIGHHPTLLGLVTEPADVPRRKAERIH